MIDNQTPWQPESDGSEDPNAREPEAKSRRGRKNSKKDNSGQYKPGMNGGGRGREDTEAPLEDRIRSRTANGQAVIEFLVRVMADDSEKSNVRIAAAEQLLLRGWGKPTLPVTMKGEIDVTEHILIEFSDEDLEAKLDANEG